MPPLQAMFQVNTLDGTWDNLELATLSNDTGRPNAARDGQFGGQKLLREVQNDSPRHSYDMQGTGSLKGNKSKAEGKHGKDPLVLVGNIKPCSPSSAMQNAQAEPPQKMDKNLDMNFDIFSESSSGHTDQMEDDQDFEEPQSPRLDRLRSDEFLRVPCPRPNSSLGSRITDNEEPISPKLYERIFDESLRKDSAKNSSEDVCDTEREEMNRPKFNERTIDVSQHAPCARPSTSMEVRDTVGNEF